MMANVLQTTGGINQEKVFKVGITIRYFHVVYIYGPLWGEPVQYPRLSTYPCVYLCAVWAQRIQCP